MKKTDIQHIIDLGFFPIPIKSDKMPMVKWSQDFEWPKSFEGVAIVTGKKSKNMVCIDVDTKYDVTGSLMKDLMSRVAELLPDVKTRLAIERTPSGGWHILFCCPDPIRNEKLSKRPPTEDEVKLFADKKQQPPKFQCIIESRGEGGYFLVSPSKGYEFKQGDLSTVPMLTNEEATTLVQVCRSFNSFKEPAIDYTPAPVERKTYGENTP